MALLRSYLFAPGHRESVIGKALAAGADAVVLDLEDAVPAGEKALARERVASAMRGLAGRGRPPQVFVRLNALSGPGWRDDVEAVVQPGLAGLRVPKAESREELAQLDEALARAEAQRGLAPGRVAVVCTVESARGLARAGELGAAPRVRGFAYGAADFSADIGADPGPDELETLHARSQLVLQSRLGGLDPPIASVYTRLDDEDGLRQTTLAARRLGFFGRSLIHPRQIAVVHDVFTPSAEEVARARATLRAFEQQGGGATATADGRFLDAAVVRRLRDVIALAESVEATRT